MDGHIARHPKTEVLTCPAIANKPQAGLIVCESLDVGAGPGVAPKVGGDDKGQQFQIADVPLLVVVRRGASKIFM